MKGFFTWKGVLIFFIAVLLFFTSATMALSHLPCWGQVFYWLKTIFWFYFMSVCLKFLYNKFKK